MSSSKPDLHHLRLGYRAAFREWIVTRNDLGAAGRGTDAEWEAQVHEIRAAADYENARDQLADAMLGPRTVDRGFNRE